jgi:hypothetical protein
MRLRNRVGSSLLEAMAVMTLSAIVMAVIAGVCAAQLRLARVTAEQAVATEAVRTVTSVLSGEARRMMAADVSADSDDSLAIRAFRGTGLPCGTTTTGVLVRYVGDRVPDPAKDSILILGALPEFGTPLFDSAPAAGTCSSLPGEAVLEWRTGGTVPPGSVLLLFESGSYHLSTRALRYRIGPGGRQPLTTEALRHPFTRFTGVTTGAIAFQIDAGGRSSEYRAVFAPPPVQP